MYIEQISVNCEIEEYIRVSENNTQAGFILVLYTSSVTYHLYMAFPKFKDAEIIIRLSMIVIIG